MADFLSELLGSKPQVAQFQKTDPLYELNQLLTGEISDWGQITDLSNLYETYMLGAMNEAIPGFSDIMKAGGADAQATLDAAKPLIEGKLPQDVIDQITRSSAFTSLMAGTAGGPIGSALTARDLGLTSLDLMKQGADLMTSGTNAAQRWGQIAGGLMLPPSAQLYSPEWFSNFIAQQKAASQATQQLQYNVNAMPDPKVAGAFTFGEEAIGTILGSALGTRSIGSGIGGMGGGGGIASMIGGGGGGGGGMSFGGINPYAATTGGINYGGGLNFGGQPLPYMGGNVSTPSGDLYGLGYG